MSSCNSVAPLGGVAPRSLATTVEEQVTFPLSHATAGLSGFDDRVSHIGVFGCVSGTGHDFTYQADNASHSHISGANFAVGDNLLPVYPVYPVYPGAVEEQGSYSGSADAFPFPIPQTSFDGGGSVSRQGEFGSECSIPTSCRLQPSSVGYDHTRDALDTVFGSSSCLPSAKPPLLCDTQGSHVSVGASVPPGTVEQGSSAGSAGAFPLSMSQISFDGAGSVSRPRELEAACSIPISYRLHHLPAEDDNTRGPLEAVSGSSSCLHSSSSAESPLLGDTQGSNFSVGASVRPGTVEQGNSSGSAGAFSFPMSRLSFDGAGSVSRPGEPEAACSIPTSYRLHHPSIEDGNRDSLEAVSGASSCLPSASFAEPPSLHNAQGSSFAVGASVPPGTMVEGRSSSGSADVSPFPTPQVSFDGPRSVSRQGGPGSVPSTSISAQVTSGLHRLPTDRDNDNTRGDFLPRPSEASRDLFPLCSKSQSLAESSAESSRSSSDARVAGSDRRRAQRIEIIRKIEQNQMKRVEIIRKIEQNQMKRAEGAEQLRVSPRQVNKILASYRKRGEEGMISRPGWKRIGKKGKPRVGALSPKRASRADNDALASGTERMWPVFPTKTDPLVEQEAFAIAMTIGFTSSFLSTTFHIGKMKQKALYKLACERAYISTLPIFNLIRKQSGAGVDWNNRSSKESAEALLFYVNYLKRYDCREVSPPVLEKLKEIAEQAVSCFNEDHSQGSSRAVEDYFLPACPGMTAQGTSSDPAGSLSFPMPVSHDDGTRSDVLPCLPEEGHDVVP